MVQHPYSYRSDTQVPPFPDDKPIIVFDGHCVLCSGWANFVLRNDKNKTYRLLAAQSPIGQALYRHYGLGGDDYQSNLLIQDGTVFIKFDGTMRMFRGLGWPWRAVALLSTLPPAWCDWLYDGLARNRLRWFGRQDSCYLPAPEDRDRFIVG